MENTTATSSAIGLFQPFFRSLRPMGQGVLSLGTSLFSLLSGLWTATLGVFSIICGLATLLYGTWALIRRLFTLGRSVSTKEAPAPPGVPESVPARTEPESEPVRLLPPLPAETTPPVVLDTPLAPEPAMSGSSNGSLVNASR